MDVASIGKLHWYHYDDNRLASFASWLPAEESPTLSRFGFVYMGKRRSVFCCGCLEQMTVGDALLARAEHVTTHPGCFLHQFSMVTPTGVRTLTTGLVRGVDARLRHLIDDDIRRTNEKLRMKTYHDQGSKLFQAMARNGFASRRCGFESECTYCRFPLSNYGLDEDDIKALHTQSSPYCMFVRGNDTVK